MSIAEANGTGTVEMDAQLWTTAVQLVSALAHLTLTHPATRKRLEPATALALERTQVRYEGEGVYQVRGRDGTHRVEARRCDCEDFQYNEPPEGLCKHVLATLLVRRASTLTPRQLQMTPEQLRAELDQAAAGHASPSPSPHGEPLSMAPEGEEGPQKLQVPKHFLQMLQEKPFIKYAGLLALAQERGLVELRAQWTYNDPELSLAHAVAVFADGRRYEEAGDSTPQNAKNIGLAWRRMSLTRAKARALRDALGLGLCSVEEME